MRPWKTSLASDIPSQSAAEQLARISLPQPPMLRLVHKPDSLANQLSAINEQINNLLKPDDETERQSIVSEREEFNLQLVLAQAEPILKSEENICYEPRPAKQEKVSVLAAFNSKAREQALASLLDSKTNSAAEH